jgi:hypothetical protein
MDEATSGQAQALEEAAQKVVGALQLVADIHIRMGEAQVQDADELQAKRGCAPSSFWRPVRLPLTKPNSSNVCSGRLACNVCGVEMRIANIKARAQFHRHQWKGPPVRILPVGLAPARYAWALGGSAMKTESLLWCLRCGGHVQKMVHSLKAPCAGIPYDRTAMDRLKAGKHPRTG